MQWVVFSYSLPSKSSSPRVSVWRQLKRVGAISSVGGAYVLPAYDRRYVNPQAAIRYGATPVQDEVAFDMPDAEFSHRGELRTFEVMQRALNLDDPALQTVADIVHEIDLRDGVHLRPETSGVDALLRGWQLAELPDSEMEARGIGLFEGLYAAFAGNAP